MEGSLATPVHLTNKQRNNFKQFLFLQNCELSKYPSMFAETSEEIGGFIKWKKLTECPSPKACVERDTTLKRLYFQSRYSPLSWERYIDYLKEFTLNSLPQLTRYHGHVKNITRSVFQGRCFACIFVDLCRYTLDMARYHTSTNKR